MKDLTVHNLVEALDRLAVILEATARKPVRKLHVVAFSSFTKSGRPRQPVEINVGDDLYLQRPEQSGAGFLSRAPSGRIFAHALETMAAGTSGSLKVGLYEKLWVTDGNPCEICDENALAGWIPVDEEFPSGDQEPDAHPNCRCSLDSRRATEED